MLSKSNTKKVNLILDLDQTIISAEEIELPLSNFKNKVKKLNYTEMPGNYNIFERPHLQQFLDFVFANFNVSVWTAADQAYALFIIDKIVLANKPERKLDYVFCVYHCDKSEKYKKSLKDLSMLWDIYHLEGYNDTNTFIVDDNQEVFECQPRNCLFVEAFEFQKDGSEKDNFLVKIRKKLNSLIGRKSFHEDIKQHIVSINKKMKVEIQ